MGYSGGTFSRTNGTNTGSTLWNSDRVGGLKITAAAHDTHDQDIADGLSKCILKDGTQTVTADIPFNSKKLTGLGAATADTDACQFGQAKNGNNLTAGSVLHAALADDAVEAHNIKSDNVTNAKILLDNDGYLRGKLAAGTSHNFLKIAASDQIVLNAPSGKEILFADNGTNNWVILGTTFRPNGASCLLGNASYRFAEIHAAADALRFADGFSGTFNTEASKKICVYMNGSAYYLKLYTA